MINDKKGKDYGVDGIMRVIESGGEYANIVFSVKSGKVEPRDIRDFSGAINRENAAAGVFITLKKPTKDMKQEAASEGFYTNKYNAVKTEKIKIVTIQQILDGERLIIQGAAEVIKKSGRSGAGQSDFYGMRKKYGKTTALLRRQLRDNA